MASPGNLLAAVMNGGTSRKLTLLAAGVVVCLGIWAVSRWASEPTWATLYRGMDLKDVAAVTDGLKKNNIRYHLDAGGTDVMVAVADVARARVTLAKDGLPASGRPGLELFDKPSWGMTDFTQRVTFQRALEGELARTIGGLRGIESAQVHLVLPTPSPLRRLERPAGASVVVTLKPGASLSPETVQGITYIVSNSVEQLAADNVAVMDDAGRVLSVPSAEAAGAGLTTRQLEIQHSVEQHLAEKVESLLATVLGLGHSRAQVSAQLSFDQVDRTIDSFNPDGAVLQTEQRSEGAPSADGSGSQTIVSNEYQNSRRIEKIVGAVGTVSRLTVSVLVDRKSVEGPNARDLSTERLQSMVANAIGVDSTRGDRLSLVAVPFEPVAVEDAKADKAGPPKTDIVMVAERVSRPVVGVVAIVVMLLLAMQLLKPSGGALSPAAVPAAGEGGRAETPALDGAEITALRNRLQSGAPERPELTAQVLRNWLTEKN
jgi:flagellar M-ring protein FliF